MQLAHIEIPLGAENGEKLPSYQMGSLFHGWLMERAGAEYAESLHRSELKPFSQYIERREDKAVWHLSTLDARAFEHLVEPFLEGRVFEVSIYHKKAVFAVEKAKLAAGFKSYKELADFHYLNAEPARNLHVHFITPTAFRSEERYQIFPQLPWIYQSLINRWNRFADQVSLVEDNLPGLLAKHSFISRYKLETRYFPLEKVSIPAFRGSLSIRISAPSPMVSLFNMLLDYAFFAGLGIKTSLGMGGVKVER